MQRGPFEQGSLSRRDWRIRREGFGVHAYERLTIVRGPESWVYTFYPDRIADNGRGEQAPLWAESERALQDDLGMTSRTAHG